MRLVMVFLVLLVSPICFAKTVDVREVSGEGRVAADIPTYYAVLGDSVVASVSDEVTYYHRDRLRSNVMVSDGEVKRSKTLPFGQSLQNDGVKYSFTGKELDDSGLYYYGARYYDPDLGRFTSVDPMKDNHPFVYTRNNPLRFIDPVGLDEEGVTQLVQPILTDDERQEAIMRIEHEMNEVYLDGVTSIIREADFPLQLKFFKNFRGANRAFVMQISTEGEVDLPLGLYYIDTKEISFFVDTAGTEWVAGTDPESGIIYRIAKPNAKSAGVAFHELIHYGLYELMGDVGDRDAWNRGDAASDSLSTFYSEWGDSLQSVPDLGLSSGEINWFSGYSQETLAFALEYRFLKRSGVEPGFPDPITQPEEWGAYYEENYMYPEGLDENP